ncbi:reverse transcriptase, partial [Phytophthora megakarya]
PHLLELLQEADGLQAWFKSLRLVHVKSDFNTVADYISKRAIKDQSSLEVMDPAERKLLQGLNRIHEKPMKDPSPRKQSLMECAFLATARNIPKHSPRGSEDDVFAVTRSKSKQVKTTAELAPGTRADDSGTDGPRTNALGTNESETDDTEDKPTAAPRLLDCQASNEDPEDVRAERWRKICSHQAHDPGLAPLLKFPQGETEQLSLRQTTHLCTSLYRLRLVVPWDLQEDILHHCHVDFQGAHQGITRPYERLRKEFYWIGMFKDTEGYVKKCVDCVTAKGIRDRRPGNTALLLFQCGFSGRIMCKAMASTEGRDLPEAHEECEFRRFGASEMIRHDRDPRFMGRVFKHFREILGSRQRATLVYRHQANGQLERFMQTVIRSVKAYIQNVDRVTGTS